MSAAVPMSGRDMLVLCALAAMWGASFMFMRIIAPQLGWLWAADLRILIGGTLVAAIMMYRRTPLHLHRDFKHFVVLGLINSAFPFALFAFAALHVPAAYSAIGNATAPLFSAVVSFFAVKEQFSASKLLGFAAGIAGVALTAGAGVIKVTPLVTAAVLATLLASVLYAFAGLYMRTRAKHIESLPMGAGSQLAAGILLIPLLPLVPPSATQIDLILVVSVLCSGILCTGLPYVLYFPLMRKIGVTRAMTVTFLVPVFAVLWAYLFLHERLSWSTFAGCLLVFCGLVLVTRAPKPAADQPSA